MRLYGSSRFELKDWKNQLSCVLAQLFHPFSRNHNSASAACWNSCRNVSLQAFCKAAAGKSPILSCLALKVAPLPENLPSLLRSDMRGDWRIDQKRLRREFSKAYFDELQRLAPGFAEGGVQGLGYRVI